MSLDSNWLDQAIAQLTCGSQFTVEQLKTIIFGQRVQTLLAKCPNILVDDYGSPYDFSVNSVYTKIQCGQLLTEADLQRAYALLEIKEKECEVSRNDDIIEEGEACKIIASGIWTKDSGSDIAISGLLTTDIVQVTLHTKAADEAIVSAIAAAGEIQITFSGTPTTSTKVNYTAIRCPIS